jgi:hypothetical protein
MSERKKKLVDARLQRRFGVLFLSTAAAAVLLQAVVMYVAFVRVSASMLDGGEVLSARAPMVIIVSTLISLVLIIPLAFSLGIRSMFKIVGPLHRFRRFLTNVSGGSQSEGCHIRAGDEFQDICDLLNEVTEPLRESSPRRQRPGAVLKFPSKTHDFVAR